MCRSCLGYLILLSCAHVGDAASHLCPPVTGNDVIERALSDITHDKLKFVGYPEPLVKRVTGSSERMVRILSYSHVPEITVENGQLVMTAAGACTTASATGTTTTAESVTTVTTTIAESVTTLTTTMTASSQPENNVDKAGNFGFSTLMLLGTLALATRGEAPALMVSFGGAMMIMGAGGTSHECGPVIEVEISIPMTGAMVDEEIMKMNQAGQFATCPAETLQWTHEPSVFGGYSGCVGEAGMNPCAQDGFEGVDGQTSLRKPYVYNSDTGMCDSTGYTMRNTTYWILWGLPMDTAELIARTGTNPVVKFPLTRGTYPSYAWGDHGDDAADLKAKFKDFLVYQSAFTSSELDQFDVEVTEGAEAGIVELYAAMALHIARTTCNRNIYILVEGPAYGYSNSRAAQIANGFSDSFFSGPSCPCANTSTCNEPTLTITTRGFVPTGTMPSAVGADNVTYLATSSSPNSPWFESMVFPENPSGVRKTPQLAAHRRICDGVYLFPMYFGGDDWSIPLDKKPDCAAWSFSITKIYSAAVRAGTLMYKNDNPDWSSAVMRVMRTVHQIEDGIYSEWSWMGQLQIYDMIMAKPVSDPTSWIGAYTVLLREKWNYVIDGFRNCTNITITNPYQGAYVWFQYLGDYRGRQNDFVSSFFTETMGVWTTTYYWGFRGANPAEWYGAGTSTYDFTRLQLYRDVNVYREVGRRAAVVCNGGSESPWMSADEWKTSIPTTRRLKAQSSVDNHARNLKEAVPRLNDKQLEHLAKERHQAQVISDNVEKHCAEGGYSTSCLFQQTGKHQEDVIHGI